MKPSHEELYQLYMVERISPEQIGRQFGYSGRSIRTFLASNGIPRLGSTHLRRGKSATWNVGLKRSAHTNQLNARAHIGKIPSNKGQGDKSFACAVCGEEVKDKPYRRHKTCSYACRTKWMSMARGENHWNFDPKKSSPQRTRLWAELKEWKMDVLRRDNFICAKCGTRGGHGEKRLTAHHILQFSDSPDSRTDVANGVTMCWLCHRSFHAAYGYHNTTREMLNEYLTK